MKHCGAGRALSAETEAAAKLSKNIIKTREKPYFLWIKLKNEKPLLSTLRSVREEERPIGRNLEPETQENKTSRPVSTLMKLKGEGPRRIQHNDSHVGRSLRGRTHGSEGMIKENIICPGKIIPREEAGPRAWLYKTP